MAGSILSTRLFLFPSMWLPWPFRRRKSRAAKLADRVVAGMIIGGAIGSIVGRSAMNDEEDETPSQTQTDGRFED